MKRVSLSVPTQLHPSSCNVAVSKLQETHSTEYEEEASPETCQTSISSVATIKTISWDNHPQHDCSHPQLKKRVGSETWQAETVLRNPERQLALLRELQASGYVALRSSPQYVHLKLVAQQLARKLSGYKQQDLHKSHGEGFNADRFLGLSDVVDQLIACGLKCRYCTEDVFVVYDISLESKQWTVDRLDNDAGHNRDNFHIACLQCNLQRRRRADDKYLFAKQMKLIKKMD